MAHLLGRASQGHRSRTSGDTFRRTRGPPPGDTTVPAGEFTTRAGGTRERCPGRCQTARCVMFTIQWTPKRSTHMPNSSPHICFSNGTVTVPPSESFSQ